MAVAVFKQVDIVGEAVAIEERGGTRLRAAFSKLPKGKHGFHIHVAGDLRGEGCAGACAHLHVGAPVDHGDAPRRGTRKAQRHSGDLGNIQIRAGAKTARYSYYLPDLKPHDLWGRTLIIHADEDDLGKGPHEDSKTTGHSGARIGCAIFGRLASCAVKKARGGRRTRKQCGGVVLEVDYAQVLGGNNVSPTQLDVSTMTQMPNLKVMNAEPSGLYTILMYDPDAVSSTLGVKANYLHWLVMNHSDKNIGDTCVTYRGPSPPSGSGIHHYTFFLFKQSAPIKCVTVERSPFDLSGFLTAAGLGAPLQKIIFEIDSDSNSK
jgi:Cu-Zn family superoxide dismutase